MTIILFGIKIRNNVLDVVLDYSLIKIRILVSLVLLVMNYPDNQIPALKNLLSLLMGNAHLKHLSGMDKTV